MAEPVDVSEASKVLENASLLRDRRRAIYNMAQHYWMQLGRPFITQPGYKVASLGAGDATDVVPFTYALEGKSKYDLLLSIRKKPQQRNVEFFNFDSLKSANWIAAIRSKPLLKIYSNPQNYVEADITQMPTKDEVFDICLIRNLNWRDFEGPKDKAKAISEATRILKRGGLLWMTFLQKSEYEEALRLLAVNNNYQLKIHENNSYPAPQVTFQDRETKQSKTVAFDSYILIAEKVGK